MGLDWVLLKLFMGWMDLLAIPVDFDLVGQVHQDLTALFHLFLLMEKEENLTKHAGKSNRAFVTVSFAWRSSSPGCWSPRLHLAIPFVYIWGTGVFRFKKILPANPKYIQFSLVTAIWARTLPDWAALMDWMWQKQLEELLARAGEFPPCSSSLIFFLGGNSAEI